MALRWTVLLQCSGGYATPGTIRSLLIFHFNLIIGTAPDNFAGGDKKEDMMLHDKWHS